MIAEIIATLISFSLVFIAEYFRRKHSFAFLGFLTFLSIIMPFVYWNNLDKASNLYYLSKFENVYLYENSVLLMFFPDNFINVAYGFIIVNLISCLYLFFLSKNPIFIITLLAIIVTTIVFINFVQSGHYHGIIISDTLLIIFTILNLPLFYTLLQKENKISYGA